MTMPKNLTTVQIIPTGGISRSPQPIISRSPPRSLSSLITSILATILLMQKFPTTKFLADFKENSEMSLRLVLASSASCPASKVSLKRWHNGWLTSKTCKLSRPKLSKQNLFLQLWTQSGPTINFCRTRASVSSKTPRVFKSSKQQQTVSLARQVQAAKSLPMWTVAPGASLNGCVLSYARVRSVTSNRRGSATALFTARTRSNSCASLSLRKTSK